MLNCRICAAPLKPYLKKNGYDIFKCTRCGFGQVNVTADDIAEFYDEQYFAGEKTHFAQEENTSIRPTQRYWIEENLMRLRMRSSAPLSVLEIGPGLGGHIGGYLQSAHPEITYAAIEISDYAAERLRSRALTVFQGRVTNPATLLETRGKYDLVFGIEVIEHDPEPHAFMRAVHDMLKPMGWAAFTTGNIGGWMARWNREKWYYLDPPAHVSYYTPKAVRSLFRAERFSPITVRRYGFNYIDMKLKTHLPGILLATHLSNISTGMSVLARREA
jgi:2-polyprenyl-3-methyl-5-hydroxy-6-metoxy-1,4-benzoquinol methylase